MTRKPPHSLGANKARQQSADQVKKRQPKKTALSATPQKRPGIGKTSSPKAGLGKPPVFVQNPQGSALASPPRLASKPSTHQKRAFLSIPTQKARNWQHILGMALGMLVLVLIDQYTKRLVQAWFLEGLLPWPISDVLSIVYVRNKGISFGLLSQTLPAWSFIVLSITTTLGLFFWMIKTPSLLLRWSLFFVISGAFGNVWDRIHTGAVIDFLDFHWHFWHFPAFNVADALISLGGVLMIGDTLWAEKRKKNA